LVDVVDRQEVRRERTRAEIVRHAWALAERDGLGSLSLRELASRVGMRAPSLYTYFASKDAIYDAMFAEGYRQLIAMESVAEEEAAQLDRVGALVLVVERWLAFCQESIPRYQLLFTHAVPGWEPSQEAYAVAQESYAQMAEFLADHGIVGGEALDLFTALNSGLASQQLANDPEGDRWVRLVRPAIEMFIAHHEQRGAP
jgi:AcrR family transcriptional regulator